jgi:N-acetylglucosamine-6-sulfatase
LVRLAALTLLAAVIAVASLASPARPAVHPQAPARANVVFILTDDLSWNLVNSRFAPHVVALQKRGVTF